MPLASLAEPFGGPGRAGVSVQRVRPPVRGVCPGRVAWRVGRRDERLRCGSVAPDRVARDHHRGVGGAQLAVVEAAERRRCGAGAPARARRARCTR